MTLPKIISARLASVLDQGSGNPAVAFVTLDLGWMTIPGFALVPSERGGFYLKAPALRARHAISLSRGPNYDAAVARATAMYEALRANAGTD